MIFSLIGELPRHQYVYVDTTYTHKEPAGFAPAVWFGLVSFPGRMWGCNVMFESGAVYRNLPPHALAFSDSPEPSWSPQQAQRWDCYGYGFSTLEYEYLRGLDCKVRLNEELEGEYLFTAAPVGDGFSAYPEQAKEFMFVKLDNGRLTVQPTDYIVFRERSFTGPDLCFPSGLARQTKVWVSE